ncbi:MAG TPA: hypothetical protein ACFCUD_12960 [Cyclobacteriaceae bacterium]
MKTFIGSSLVTLTLFSGMLAFLFIIYFMKQDKKTQEATYMIEACEDISAYEVLRAESDIEKIISIIKSHIEEHNSYSNDYVKIALTELKDIEREVTFRNIDQSFYRNRFMKVLKALSNAEMKLAMEHLDRSDFKMAKLSLIKARNYLNDAYHFSTNDSLTRQ